MLAGSRLGRTRARGVSGRAEARLQWSGRAQAGPSTSRPLDLELGQKQSVPRHRPSSHPSSRRSTSPSRVVAIQPALSSPHLAPPDSPPFLDPHGPSRHAPYHARSPTELPDPGVLRPVLAPPSHSLPRLVHPPQARLVPRGRGPRAPRSPGCRHKGDRVLAARRRTGSASYRCVHLRLEPHSPARSPPTLSSEQTRHHLHLPPRPPRILTLLSSPERNRQRPPRALPSRRPPLSARPSTRPRPPRRTSDPTSTSRSLRALGRLTPAATTRSRPRRRRRSARSARSAARSATRACSARRRSASSARRARAR